MTTMRPHHVVASLLIVGAVAIAVGLAAKESAPTGHEGHTMPATTAAAKSEPGQGVRMTITGEVMDPACFLEAGAKSISPGHFQCAIDCARSGQTLAIYDRANDRIYFIAGELPGKNPNDPVINFIHQKVDVTGGVYHRSGVYGIVITKVVPHKEKG
ncbi:MAG: hypothetical protein E6K79_02435 [Candidatus Eisenbacteria bacterium]|uniref:Uncharacterized protein n=1 Tax=Eiseniibacteriota bacterium TaxID=2212470 RepID=A0A538TT18_UNCEI|nr:MAG: hypothetical protein E6K79_02435 [Candidatus Eisenbacteria bacterium]